MKSVNNEQALLAVLLLVLTSLATVSGSMPTVQSIETYFDSNKEEGFKAKKEGFKAKKEKFKAKKEGFKAKKEGFKAKKEGFKAKKEGFKAKKEGFANCASHQEEETIEGFQGDMFAKF